MRQIKFRGKVFKTFQPDINRWAYGMPTISASGKVSIRHEKKGEWNTWKTVTIHVDTLGQFTGLLDRNGKEIYEGDLIRDEEFTYVVYWMEDVAAFMVEEYHSECDAPKIFLLSDFGRECEVVGNIHEQSKS